MKSKKIIATLLVSTSIFSSMVSMIPAFAEENIQVVTQQEQEVNIPDLNLKKILNKKLGQAENTKITAKQLATIKELDIDNQNIASIEGLQYCVNLESLKLGLPSTAVMSAIKESNTISDISPLKGLKNLKHLQLSRLQITDFSPLKDLPLDLESSMIDPDSDDACFENIVHQLIANEDGSVTWENPDKDVLGNAMIPEDLCGGVYNKEDNTITWSKEAFKQHRESETGNNNGLDGVLECLTLTNESYTDNHMNLIVNHELQVKDFSEIVKTYHKVKDLFSSDATDEALFNSYVPLAANITQDQIDKAKEQVNSLSDQEYFVVDGNKKTGQDLQILIQKAQDLFNQSQKEESATQTINIGGQGIDGYSDHSHDSGFARVSLEVKDHKASLVKHSDYQFHWGGWKTSKYASIKLTDPNGNVLYDQAWKGNDTVKGNGYQKFGTFAQYDLPEGSTVEIYHAEGPWHRFSTNDNDNLKTKLEKTGYTYTYKMQNNQLVLTNVDENANGKHEDEKQAIYKHDTLLQ